MGSGRRASGSRPVEREAIAEETVRSDALVDPDRFIRDVTPDLIRALTIRVGDRATAEDLAHEALARAIADWDRVAAMESPTGWVFRVALNLSASRWRRVRVRRRVEATIDRGEPFVQLFTAETLAVRDALHRLTRRQAEVIVLRFYSGFDVAEVGDILGISPSTVTTLTARALARLRLELEDGE